MSKTSDEHICNNPYHIMPVIPKRGMMTFENNDADDALATIKCLLSNSKVNVTITWETVNTELKKEDLKKVNAAATYALMNAERRERLGTKG